MRAGEASSIRTSRPVAKASTFSASIWSGSGSWTRIPLPAQIDASRVIAAIDPAKDVDGFHPINAGRLATGLEALVPCTPYGCLYLLKKELGSITGKSAVVIGRSNIVGKPMALLLIGESATVTVAHSRTCSWKNE